MFRPLLGHHHVYCLCLGAELVFDIDPYFDCDYITCSIMLFFCLSVWGGPESLGIFVSKSLGVY
jgi:hypothetical protein